MNARKRAAYAAKKQQRLDAAAGKNALKNVEVLDGFYSTTTGAGISGTDKFASYNFSANDDLTKEVLEGLYRDSDIAAKVVEQVTKDALRNGYSLESGDFSDGEAADIVEEVETRLKLTNETKQSRIYSRLFGGGGVLIGADDGKMSSPRNDGKPIRFLRAVSSCDLTAAAWHADVAAQNFASVAIYDYRLPSFSGETNALPIDAIEVDGTYVEEFYGILTTEDKFRELDGWGDSVLRRVYEPLKQFEASYQAVLHALSESSVPVYKVEGLLQMLASENADLLAARFQLLNAGKSNYKAIVLGENESFERVAAQLAEAANVVGAAMNRVSGASNMPSTVLWGQSPQGMNATGTSDLELWNQQVIKEQTLELAPVILDLYRAVLSDPEGPTQGKVPTDLAVRFPPLLTPSIQDQVNNYAQTAGADVGYVGAGILKAEQVALSRSKQKSTLFPSIDTKALEDALSLDADLDVLSDPQDVDGQENASSSQQPATSTTPEGLTTQPGDEPQKAALNGAQISGLVAIATTVADGVLPLDTAKAIAAACFPLDAATLYDIFAPLPEAKFDEEQNKPDPVPPVMGANPLAGLGEDLPEEEEAPEEAPKESPFGDK